MRPRSPWGNSHATLKRLYDERIGDSMTQKEFGRRYGIGGQSMVAQLLSGAKPLSIDAAAKFAHALRCNISDFCPEMSEHIKVEILPVLGKALRRAACILLLPLLHQFVPSDAQAAPISHNYFVQHCFAKSLNLIHIARYFAAMLRRVRDFLLIPGHFRTAG